MIFLFSVALIWVSHFLVDVMIGIWPVYKTLANFDLAIAGLIGGGCVFLGEGLQIVFGSLSDRGYRKALIFGGLLASTANAYLIYTDSYLGIFFLYLLTCMGSGAFHPAAASLMGDLSPSKAGVLIAIFSSGGAVGMAISQLAFTQVDFFFDGQTFWLALPAIMVVCLALCCQVGSQPAVTAAAQKGEFSLKIIGRFFQHRPLRMLYFSQVSNMTMLWGMLFLLPDFLLSRGYDSWISFGGGHLFLVIGSALMMIPAGYLADRYSNRSVIIFATAIAAVLFYFLLMTPMLSNVAVLALLFFLGAALGAVNPVSVTLGTIFAPNHKGAVSAFTMGLVWCVSQGIGQSGGGFLATCFIDDAPAKALAILGGMFAVGLAAASQLPSSESRAIMVAETG